MTTNRQVLGVTVFPGIYRPWTVVRTEHYGSTMFASSAFGAVGSDGDIWSYHHSRRVARAELVKYWRWLRFMKKEASHKASYIAGIPKIRRQDERR